MRALAWLRRLDDDALGGRALTRPVIVVPLAAFLGLLLVGGAGFVLGVVLLLLGGSGYLVLYALPALGAVVGGLVGAALSARAVRRSSPMGQLQDETVSGLPRAPREG